MSIEKVYTDSKITVFCADTDSIYKPYPSYSELPDSSSCGQFTLKCARNGKTAFQIIVASKVDITVKSVVANGLNCFSVEGTDIYGNDFIKEMPIYANKPWPVWCHFEASQAEGDELSVMMLLTDGTQITFPIFTDVSDEYDTSLSDGQSYARLEWLNSRAGISDKPLKGYDAVTVSGNEINILGRCITVCDGGYIGSVTTVFEGANTIIGDSPREILSSPIQYEIYENGELLCFEPESLAFLQKEPTFCTWQAESVCGELVLEVKGRAEYDGSVELCARIKNGAGRRLSVRFVHSPRKEFSKYFMGLGIQGSKTPEEHVWRWDENKHQNALWCGNVNGGVYICPTAENVNRPFVNIYFHHSKNFVPEQWANEGKGRFCLTNADQVSMFYESGEFVCDDEKAFPVNLMITPLKKIDTKEHWNTHYYHKNYNVPYTEEDIEDAKNVGCTHINLHHGNDALPFLNYPMYDIESIKQLTDMAHKYGMGLKPYYTVRELTSRLPELFAFRSLRDEIFPEPRLSQVGESWQDGVDEYITDNFGAEVIPAWKHTFVGGKFDGTTDPTIITNPDGRISNFYLGSIEWLIQNTGIDGLYIDDVGYGRTVMRRVRNLFEKYKDKPRIDFHTWNHFEDKYGAGYGHNMLIYMELFPCIDSLWVGEGYKYNSVSPEYMLTEISGIPFGIMGEMLAGDYNVWRGMLFGMTLRYPYYRWFSGESPVGVWKLLKSFENSQMIGFWEDERPIFADDEDVVCTVYYDAQNDRYLCCFANYADDEVSFKICFNNGKANKIYAPEIAYVQENRDIVPDERITLCAKGGIMVIVE